MIFVISHYPFAEFRIFLLLFAFFSSGNLFERKLLNRFSYNPVYFDNIYFMKPNIIHRQKPPYSSLPVPW